MLLCILRFGTCFRGKELVAAAAAILVLKTKYLRKFLVRVIAHRRLTPLVYSTSRPIIGSLVQAEFENCTLPYDLVNAKDALATGRLVFG